MAYNRCQRNELIAGQGYARIANETSVVCILKGPPLASQEGPLPIRLWSAIISYQQASLRLYREEIQPEHRRAR